MSRCLVLRVWAYSLALFLFAGAPVAAVDFLRGDANEDARVSIADAHFIFSFLFRGGSPPACCWMPTTARPRWTPFPNRGVSIDRRKGSPARLSSLRGQDRPRRGAQAGREARGRGPRGRGT